MIMADDGNPSPAGQEITEKKEKKQAYWLIYLSVLLSGLLLLTDALAYTPVQKITARLGITLLFSAFALIVGNGRRAGFVATGLIWAAVIVTFFY
jgi:hypothetical protein